MSHDNNNLKHSQIVKNRLKSFGERKGDFKARDGYDRNVGTYVVLVSTPEAIKRAARILSGVYRVEQCGPRSLYIFA